MKVGGADDVAEDDEEGGERIGYDSPIGMLGY